jgi:hypothetical protein
MIRSASLFSKWLVVVLVVLAAIAIPIQRVFVGDFRIDDAYITFEFSRNLAAGNGLNYGAGQLVEGYSNFLWMILAVPLEMLSVDVYLGMRHLAWGFWLALVWVVASAARREAGALAAVLATVAIVVSTDLVSASQSALETVPFCALVLGSIVAVTSENIRLRRWASLVGAAAGLMRIDGFLVLAFVVTFDLATSMLERKAPVANELRAWVRRAAPGVAVLLAYWAFRIGYYGHLLPSTVRAKELIAQLNPGRGASQVHDAVRALGLLALLPLAGLALARPTRLRVAAALFVVAQTAYATRVGGDWMPFWRFLLPGLVPLYLLSALGAAQLVSNARKRGPAHWRCAVAVVVAAFGFHVAHADARTLQTPIEQSQRQAARQTKEHTARLLEARGHVAAMIRDPKDVLVTDYGGVHAYYVRATIIEQWGLANWSIATRGDTQGVASIYGKTCIPCYGEFAVDYLYAQVAKGGLLTDTDPFGSRDAVIRAVFQGEALDPVLGLKTGFVVGRVTDSAGKSLYFLERKRPERPLSARKQGVFTIEYPYGDG